MTNLETQKLHSNSMLNHLQNINRKFYKLVSLSHIPDYMEELKKLEIEGKIKFRKGLNGPVIELL